MMGERQDDGDGEAMGRGKRRCRALCVWRRRRLRRDTASLAEIAPQRKQPRFDVPAVVFAHARIGDGGKELLQPLFERRAPLWRIEIVARAFALPENVDERPRLGEAARESAGAFIAYEIVWVRTLRQEGEAEGVAFAQDGEHAVDGARGGGFAGA